MSTGSGGNYTCALPAPAPEGQVSISFKHLLDGAQPTANNVYRVNERMNERTRFSEKRKHFSTTQAGGLTPLGSPRPPLADRSHSGR